MYYIHTLAENWVPNGPRHWSCLFGLCGIWWGHFGGTNTPTYTQGNFLTKYLKQNGPSDNNSCPISPTQWLPVTSWNVVVIILALQHRQSLGISNQSTGTKVAGFELYDSAAGLGVSVHLHMKGTADACHPAAAAMPSWLTPANKQHENGLSGVLSAQIHDEKTDLQAGQCLPRRFWWRGPPPGIMRSLVSTSSGHCGK